MLALERKIQIGQRIYDLRYEQALTQTDLAELSGVNEITISNIEREKQRPSARTLRKLANAFGIEVRELTRATVMPARESPVAEDSESLLSQDPEKLEETKREHSERHQQASEGSGDSADTGDRTS